MVEPDLRFVRINGQVVPSAGGTFYLDYTDETGKRRQRPIGKSPATALDAWRMRVGIKSGSIPPEADPYPEPEKPKGKTIDQAIADYLVEVAATKGSRTLKQYRHDLLWFRSVCTKTYIADLDRSDAMALFTAGRNARVDSQPLNQKTINRRVIIVLHAMRNRGATITMVAHGRPRPSLSRLRAGNKGTSTNHCFSLNHAGRFFIQEAHHSTPRNRKSLSCADGSKVFAELLLLGIIVRPVAE